MQLRRPLFFVLTLSAGYVAFAGCGDDDSSTDDGADASSDAAPDTGNADVTPGPDARSPEYTGSACAAPADCYGDLDGASLKGEAVCIDKVTNGYCTHKCETDEDCCAVPGECRTGLAQVCASFENTNEKYCFLSCEDDAIGAATDAGASDAGTAGDDYCRGNASNEFGCRSTGGGKENRKACLPVGPSGDGGTKDAAADGPIDAGDAGDAADAADGG